MCNAAVASGSGQLWPNPASAFRSARDWNRPQRTPNGRDLLIPADETGVALLSKACAKLMRRWRSWRYAIVNKHNDSRAAAASVIPKGGLHKRLCMPPAFRYNGGGGYKLSCVLFHNSISVKLIILMTSTGTGMHNWIV